MTNAAGASAFSASDTASMALLPRSTTTFSPDGGTYEGSSVPVTVLRNGGATLRYTTDGVPTESSPAASIGRTGYSTGAGDAKGQGAEEA